MEIYSAHTGKKIGNFTGNTSMKYNPKSFIKAININNEKIHIALDTYFFFERDNFKKIKDYLDTNEVENEVYKIIPFSHEIQPSLPIDRTIVPFGSIEFVQTIHKDKAIKSRIFYDELIFTNENCLKNWGDLCLNSDSRIMTVKEIFDFKDDSLYYFMRPIEDTKVFAGGLYKFSEVKLVLERHSSYENSNITAETKIIVSSPKNIKREWRNFIINKKFIASSKYKENGIHSEDSDNIPQEVISLCEQAVLMYNPADAFVLDICQTDEDKYKIVEFGCIHNCGFYKADIEKILSEFIEL